MDMVVSQQSQEMSEAFQNLLSDFSINEVADDQQRSVFFKSLSSRGQMQVATGFTEGEIQGFNQMIHSLCPCMSNRSTSLKQLA
jgi:hypothetical protein